MQRTAIPPARRWHLRTCGDAKKYIPQAPALRTFFATFFSELKTLAVRCGALRCGILSRNDGNHA